MRTIDAEQLKHMIDDDPDLVVVNVLDPDSFEAEHIPGSHNVPFTRLDLPRKVEMLAGAKDRPVVVYCSSEECQASPQAARRLEKSGFTDVIDFVDGIEGWKQAGYQVDG